MNPVTLKLFIQALAFNWLVTGGVILLAAYAAWTMYRVNQYLKRKDAE